MIWHIKYRVGEATQPEPRLYRGVEMNWVHVSVSPGSSACLGPA
jgi:hypothetical protein